MLATQWPSRQICRPRCPDRHPYGDRRFSSTSPGDLLSAEAISGLSNGEQVRGIDWVNGILYALGDQSHLYTVNPTTGAATLVGPGAFTPTLDGIDFGFNAGTSQLYVASDTGQNLTLNPLTGAATVGPNYTGAPVDAMAYDYANGDFYGISADTDDLYLMNPTTGATSLIGPSGVSFSGRIGFDISPTTGQAYFAGTIGTEPELYNVNLVTGAFTEIGALVPDELGTAGTNSIAVVPEPATVAFLTIGGLALLLYRRRK